MGDNLTFFNFIETYVRCMIKWIKILFKVNSETFFIIQLPCEINNCKIGQGKDV